MIYLYVKPRSEALHLNLSFAFYFWCEYLLFNPLLTTLEDLCINHEYKIQKGFFQLENITSVLVISFRFIWIPMSTAIIHILFFQRWDRL